MKGLVIRCFILAILPLLYFSPTVVQAQVTQTGVVMEYMERQQKTPLSQVEVNVIGAGSTVSSTQGQFQLKFRTMRAGDKVTVRRIEKSGYEIFNREALDQWHISRNNRDFIIVMCRSERFRKIRNEYERIASASYERQLKREESTLKQQRQKNKITQQQYNESLTQLRNDYEARLENLDNYIDRFARIDLSVLSEEENRIIELVKKGKMEEAVKAYDALDLDSKYQEQEATVKRAQADIDRLSDLYTQSTEARDQAFAAIKRKNDLLYLAGGTENIAKIGVSLRRTADADTTYYPAMAEYAHYLVEQQKPLEALTWLRLAEKHTDNTEQRIDIKLEQGNAYVIAGRYEEAKQCFDDTNNDIIGVYKEQEEMKIIMQNIVLQQLANMYSIQGKYQDAYNCWKLNTEILEKLVTLIPDIRQFEQDYATGLYSMAHIELLLGHFNDASSHGQKSVGIYEKLYRQDSKMYELDLANSRQTLAEIYYQLRKNDKAMSLMNDVMPVVEQYYSANPRKYSSLMNDCIILKGNTLRTAKRFDEAEKLILRAIKINEETMAAIPGQLLFKKTKANYMETLGWIKYGQGKFNEAIKTFKTSIDILQQIEYNDANQKFLLHAYYGAGNSFIHQGKAQEAFPYFQRTLTVAEKMYRVTPILFANEYHLALYAMSSVCLHLGKNDEALNYANRDLDIIQKHQEITFDKPEDSAIMGAYICQQRKQYSKALEYTEKLLKYVPTGVMHTAYLGFKGQLLDEMGRKREAKKIFEQALQLSNSFEKQMPNDLQNLENKGELLLRLGRQNEATQVLNRILQIDPQYIQKHGHESSFYLLLKSMK